MRKSKKSKSQLRAISQPYRKTLRKIIITPQGVASGAGNLKWLIWHTFNVTYEVNVPLSY